MLNQIFGFRERLFFELKEHVIIDIYLLIYIDNNSLHLNIYSTFMYSLFASIYFVCECVCIHTHVTMHMWSSQDNMKESLFSDYYVILSIKFRSSGFVIYHF